MNTFEELVELVKVANKAQKEMKEAYENSPKEGIVCVNVSWDEEGEFLKLAEKINLGVVKVGVEYHYEDPIYEYAVDATDLKYRVVLKYDYKW